MIVTAVKTDTSNGKYKQASSDLKELNLSLSRWNIHSLIKHLLHIKEVPPCEANQNMKGHKPHI